MPLHINLLAAKEVLVGTTVEVSVAGEQTTHVLMPGLAQYLIARYAGHPTITVQPLNEKEKS